jgi:hypothetical protein
VICERTATLDEASTVPMAISSRGIGLRSTAETSTGTGAEPPGRGGAALSARPASVHPEKIDTSEVQARTAQPDARARMKSPTPELNELP